MNYLADIEANHANHVVEKSIWTRLFGWPGINPEVIYIIIIIIIYYFEIKKYCYILLYFKKNLEYKISTLLL